MLLLPGGKKDLIYSEYFLDPMVCVFIDRAILLGCFFENNICFFHYQDRNTVKNSAEKNPSHLL